MLKWIAKLPSTNARIVVTLVVLVCTAGRYLLTTTWQPSWEWLVFLAAMSGLDVTQFYAKRKTYLKEDEDAQVQQEESGSTSIM